MTASEMWIMAIRFFLTSIIFIIGAYLLQVISEKKRLKSQFTEKTRTTFILCSLASLLAFGITCVISKLI